MNYNMDSFLLSVIIPHYNSPDYLRVMLDSILGECEKTQIIVIDDNSTKETDKLEELRNQYSDRVDFFVNNSGVKGPGAARNIGLDNAKGKWVIFSDADDWMVAGWFKRVSEYFDSECDIVYFAPECKNLVTNTPSKRADRYIRAVNSVKNKEENGELALRYGISMPVSKMIRKEILDVGIDNEPIRFSMKMHSEDVMLSLYSAYVAEKICADTRPVYCITERNATLTRERSESAYRQRIDSLLEKNDFLRSHLSTKDYKFVMCQVDAYGKLRIARVEKYGFNKYRSLFRKHHVPLWDSRVIFYRQKFMNSWGKKLVALRNKVLKSHG